jgi:hypothetical protein
VWTRREARTEAEPDHHQLPRETTASISTLPKQTRSFSPQKGARFSLSKFENE